MKMGARPARDLEQFCASLGQGCVVSVLELPRVHDDPEGTSIHTDLGVALLSQTCDLVRTTPEVCLVAPVVALEDSGVREARRGKSTRYVPLPESGEFHFADLEGMRVVTKSFLSQYDVVSRPVGDSRRDAIGYRVSRRFGRHAFPDGIGVWLVGFQDHVRSVSQKEDHPEGILIDLFVEQFRLQYTEVNGLVSAELQVVLVEGELPPPDTPSDLAVEAIRDWLGYAQRSSHEIAARLAAGLLGLEGTRVAGLCREELWQALTEVWSSKCRVKGSPSVVPSDLADGCVSGGLYDARDYSLAMISRSVELDLGDLSHLG